MDFDEIIRFEKKLLDSRIRKSAEELALLLSPDFYEIGTSGKTYNRELIIERLTQEFPQVVMASDFVIVALAPNVVQLRFKTMTTNVGANPLISLRSSIWKKTDGRWQMLFHQGTATANS